VHYFHRRAFAAFNRRDWEVNALSHAPDCALRSGEFTRFLPDAREVYRGPEGYLEAMELWIGAWANLRMDTEDIEIHDAGGGKMVAIIPFVGAGELSGARLDERLAAIHEFRQGQLISQTFYTDPARALDSVGLTHRRR
jgi:ketosteroid isomerase-like protein